MAQPTIRVRLGFTSDVFTLDDLVRGVLDSGLLGGSSLLTDVTSDVQNIAISRGRSKDLDSFFTGSCAIKLNNNSRKYENTNTSSPYYPGIEPFIIMHVDATTDGGSNYEDLFVGFVADINLTYDGVNSFATFSGFDAFIKINNTELVSQSFSSTDSGTLINNILDNANVKYSAADRDIETGISNMQALSSLSGNTLAVLQTIERSENGLLFMSKSGKLTFKNRHTTFPSTTGITFSDDGSNIPYTKINYINDDNEIYNFVNLQRIGGSNIAKEDLPSQRKYLVRTLTRTGLYNDNDTEVTSAAEFLLGKFKDALLRFDNLEVNVKDLSTANQNSILSSEVGDIVTVELTPPGTGSPSQVSSTEILDQISYNITPDTFTVSYKLSNANQQAFFRLDNSLFGELDTDKLGY